MAASTYTLRLVTNATNLSILRENSPARGTSGVECGLFSGAVDQVGYCFSLGQVYLVIQVGAL